MPRGLRSANLTLNPSAPRCAVTDADRAAALGSPLVAGIDPSLARGVLASCEALALPAGTTLLAPGDHNAACSWSLPGGSWSSGRSAASTTSRWKAGTAWARCPSSTGGRLRHVLASTDSRVLEVGSQQSGI
jgi:hypothetical protein